MKKSGFTVFITVVSALAAVAAAVVAATLFFEKKRRTKRNWSITSTAPFSKCLGSGYNVRAAV